MITNITIEAADDLLPMGFGIISGLPYDMDTMSARYLVYLPNGHEQEMTSSEVYEILEWH